MRIRQWRLFVPNIQGLIDAKNMSEEVWLGKTIMDSYLMKYIQACSYNNRNIYYYDPITFYALWMIKYSFCL